MLSVKSNNYPLPWNWAHEEGLFGERPFRSIFVELDELRQAASLRAGVAFRGIEEKPVRLRGEGGQGLRGSKILKILWPKTSSAVAL